jgi:hypothetical protein
VGSESASENSPQSYLARILSKAHVGEIKGNNGKDKINGSFPPLRQKRRKGKYPCIFLKSIPC